MHVGWGVVFCCREQQGCCSMFSGGYGLMLGSDFLGRTEGKQKNRFRKILDSKGWVWSVRTEGD